MGTITLRCAHCRSEKFIKPINPKPHDVVTCAGCGRKSKYADVQSAGLDVAKKALTDALRKAGLKPK